MPRLAVHAFGHVHATQTLPAGFSADVTYDAKRKNKGQILPIRKVDGKDVRVVRDAHGRVFANSAGLKVSDGQLRQIRMAEEEDPNGPKDPMGQHRAPLLLQLDHDGTRWKARALKVD